MSGLMGAMGGGGGGGGGTIGGGGGGGSLGGLFGGHNKWMQGGLTAPDMSRPQQSGIDFNSLMQMLQSTGGQPMGRIRR